MKVWIVIEGDTGSDQTSVVGVYDTPEKAAKCMSLAERHRPRDFEEWTVE